MAERFDKTDPRQSAQHRARRRVLLRGAAAGGVLLALVIFVGLYLSSSSFEGLVRNKLVQELQEDTGGRVEMRSFTWNLSRLQFEARDLTIHGTEAPGEVPYAHVDVLRVRMKIVSILHHQVRLSQLSAEHPVVHIIRDRSGAGNQPPATTKAGPGNVPVQQIFDLAADRLDINNGELLWNDRRIPLDIQAENMSASAAFNAATGEYQLSASAGNSRVVWKDAPPLEGAAQLEATLYRDHADIRALHLTSGRSKLDASGRISDYNDLAGNFDYRASLYLPALAPELKVEGVRQGQLDLEGKARGNLNVYESTGRMTLRNGDYQTSALRLSQVEAGARYTLDRSHIIVSNLFARLLGGTVRGEVRVFNWQRASRAPAFGSAELQLEGVDLRPVASSLSSRSLPLDKLDLRGAAAGHLSSEWRGSPANAETRFTLDVSPSAAPQTSGLPVTARLQGIFHGHTQELEVSSLNLSTPGNQLQASGALGSGSGQLRLTLNTGNLAEFQPLVSAWLGAAPPLELRGRANFNGTVTGRFTAPSIHGHLVVTDFTTTLDIPQFQLAAGPSAASPRAPRSVAHKIHWDSAALDLDYDAHTLAVRNAQLAHGDARIRGNAAAQLARGAFTAASPLTAHVELQHGDATEARGMVGLDLPLTGALDASLDLTGSLRDMRATGNAALTGGELYSEPYKSLRSDVNLSSSEARLTNLRFAQNGGLITGAAALNFDSRALDAQLTGSGLDLAHLKTVQRYAAGLGPAGKASFTINSSGTLDAPVLNGQAKLTGLALKGQPIGDATLTLATRGQELTVTARSSFRKAEVNADGAIQLRGDLPGRLTLQLSHFDANPLLQGYFNGRITGSSNIDLKLDVTGPFRHPQLLTAHGEIATLQAEIEKIALHNDGPIEFTYSAQTASVQRLHIVGEGTDLTLTGTAGFDASHPLALIAKGSMNLKLLQGVYPDVVSYGTTAFEVEARGTASDPRLRGAVQIQNAGISLIDMPNGLAGINGSLIFNDRRLQVQSLTAHTGGGQLSIGGFVTYNQGLYFDLSASGRDVRLRYPPGISAMANADLRLSGSPASSLLSGEVTVTKFGVNPRFDFANYLALSKQTATSGPGNSIAGNQRLDVHVVTTPELRVETSLAKIAGDADLRIRGTAARPTVLGRVNIAEGDLFFNSTKYHLERGDILFANPVRVEPIVNIEASARVREYDITIGFHGSVDKLQTTYRSEPPLPSADVIALLALGRTREETVMQTESQPNNFTETASDAVLGQALNAAVSSRVQKLFGVSRIKIDPQVGGPENNPNARITVEQQINNNITLTYITNVSQSSQQIIQAEFNVTRNTSLVLVRDQNGVLGFDVRIRRRKR